MTEEQLEKWNPEDYEFHLDV